MACELKQLSGRVLRKCYVITYSRADMSKFPTKREFAEGVVEAFSQGNSNAKVKHWVCCKETHADGGFHYHMAISLSENKRWVMAKKYLEKKHGIVVNFTDSDQYNYHSAYRYVVKEDPQPLLSDSHPDLDSASSPLTGKANKALMKNARCKRSGTTLGFESASTSNAEPTQGPSRSTKRRRLSNLDVSEVIIKKNIRSDTELLALAKEQKEEGKMDLPNFILSKSSKAMNELINVSWKMETAPKSIARNKQNRMEVLFQCVEEECKEGCVGQWLVCAREVLRNNGVNAYVYAAAVRELLVKGRGKYRNIMIIGPANCGKTFLLDPLNEIYDTFTNPSSASYAWLGVEDKEAIFLNDFRYSQEIMPWKDILLLLEGQALHLAAPKTSYAQDILFDKDTPIFATSKETIKFPGKYNTTDEIENEMMAVRWKTFVFHHQIPESDHKVLPRCKKCFASLILLGHDA